MIPYQKFNFVFIVLFGCLFFSSSLKGQQAPNDTCTFATDIPIPATTPFEGCINFTGDVSMGTVDLPGLCSGNNDLWYTFTAAGPNAIIEVTGTAAVACISIGQWDAGDCMSTFFFESGGSPLVIQSGVSATNLVAGSVYFVVISFDTDAVTAFDLCIQNPPPPTNNDPCTPIVFTPGSCADYTTLGADAFAAGRPISLPCWDGSQGPSSTVWFEVTPTPPDNNILEVIITGNQGDIVVGIWINDCADPRFFDEDCSDGSAPIIFENEPNQIPYLLPGQTYLISVTTYQDQWDDFNLCINESFNPSCAPNEDCASAEAFPIVLDNASDLCVDGCNNDMPPYLSGAGGCFEMPNGVAWYSFTTGAATSRLFLTVTSADVSLPQVAIFTGSCPNPAPSASPQGCAIGSNGLVELSGVILPQSTTIFIAISDGGGAGGDFELCAYLESFDEICVGGNQNLTIASRTSADGIPATPLEGPYCPGDEVQFCYDISSFDVGNSNCQWLHGIVPTFGEGWDLPVNMNPGGGVATAYVGNWIWYDQDVITYNLNNAKFSVFTNCDGRKGICSSRESDCAGTPLTPGTGMPAGWYVYNTTSPGGPTGPNANNTWGDGNGCAGTNASWNVCFTLTVKDNSICGGGGCAPDLSVSMFTTADAETGGYTNTDSPCKDDGLLVFNGQLNCNGAPLITATYTEPICSGASVNIQLMANVASNFSWTIESASPGLSGQGPGQGNRITDFIENTGTDIGTIEYHIFATPPNGCPGDTVISIDILPQITADAGENDVGCANACLFDGPYQLGSTPQNPDWTYTWTGGAVSDAWISNPTACPVTTTTYTLTVTNASGCPEAVDQITIEILPALTPELLGDTEVCIGETFMVTVDYGYGGGYNFGTAFEWYITDINGLESYFTYTSDPVVDITLAEAGIHEIRVVITDLNGCMTEAMLQVNVNVSPDIELIAGPTQICEGGSVELTIDLLNPFELNGANPAYFWIDLAGDTIRNGAAFTANMAGTYEYGVFDAPDGCTTIESVVVTSTPGISTTPDTITLCDEGSGMATFDLSSTQPTINSDPGINFTWYSDAGGTILVPDSTNFVNGSGSAWVVLSTGACTTLPFEVPLIVESAATVAFSGVNSPYCILDDAVQFSATPTGGVFSGSTGISSTGMFDPDAAGAGNHTIYYDVSPAMGCPGRDSVMVTVTASVTPILGATPNPMCITQAPITITTDLGPGIFAGNGVTDGVTGIFDPSIAGVGMHSLNYVTNSGCTDTAFINITVVDTIMPPVISCGSPGTDFVVFNWAHASSTDFIVTTYVGGVLRDNMIPIAGTTHMVNGLMAGQIVSIEIIAVGTGLCGNSSVGTFECQANFCPVISITMADLPNTCESSTSVSFSATPTGGVFSGAGGIVVDANTGEIDPSSLGDGDHKVYYTLSQAGGCMYIDSAMITVDPEWPVPNVLCAGVSLDSVSFTWNTVPGITNYIINTFIGGTPDVVGSNITTNQYSRNGLNQGDVVTIEVIYVSTNSCGNSAAGQAMCTTQDCTPNPPSIDAVSALCETGAPVVLSATPTGGIFGGLGVDPTAGTFDPSITGAGVHQISYVYVDGIGCSQSNTGSVTVESILPPPMVNCINTTPTSVEMGWSHLNAAVTSYEISYQINSGPIMSETTTNTSILIMPLTQGDTVMMQVVAQGINSCGDSEPSPVQECIAEDCPSNPIDFSGNKTEFCISEIDLYQILVTPSGGVFSGSSANVDANGVFDPASAGLGTHTITYMIDDGSCPYTSTIELTVFDIVPPPTVFCVDQDLDAVVFNWDGPDGVEYIVTYSINNGPIQGPFTTSDKMYTVNGLTELDDVQIFVEIRNVGPCGNSTADDESCVALNCDIVIAGLPAEIVICDQTPVSVMPLITGSGTNYSYEWTTPTGAIMTKDIMALEAGDYTLNVMDNRLCVANGSFTLRQDPIIPLITISDPTCFGEEDGLIRIDGISGGTPNYEVSLNGGAFSDATEFTSLSAADYDITIRDAEGCTWSEGFSMSEPREFLFNIDTTLTVAFGDSLIYDVVVDERTDSLVTFKIWLSTDPNIVCPECWTLVSLPTFTSNYVLNVETANGCPGNGVLRSIIEHDRTVYIPNVFRPNSSDTRNQIFQLFTSEEVEMVEAFQVYNRWGDRMFGIDVPYDPRTEEVGWNGIYRGTLAATGVYVYWIRVRFTDGTEGFFNGDVTLLR